MFSGKDTCCTHPLSARMLVSLVESVDLCVCVFCTALVAYRRRKVLFIVTTPPQSATHTQ